MNDDWKKNLIALKGKLFGQGQKEQPKTDKRQASPSAIKVNTTGPGSTKASTTAPPRVLTPVAKSGSGPAKSVPVNAARGPETRITIGLDFGTETTKVCVRQELSGADVPVYPLEINAVDGAAPYLLPSIITLQPGTGKVYFGQAKDGDEYLRTKICVACEKDAETAGKCMSREACMFQRGGGAFKASELVTLYLAWMMKETARLSARYFKGALRPTYNVSIPMKQLDTGELLESYRLMVWRAWSVKDHVQQGMDLLAGLQRIRQISSSSIVPTAESPVQLCPETSAAIVSYVLAPNTREGLYAILDVGAWTSDLSFFRLTSINRGTTGSDTMAFFDADVHHVAGHAIDDRIFRGLCEMWGFDAAQFESRGTRIELLEDIRRYRERDAWSDKIAYKSAEGNIVNDQSIPQSVIQFGKEVIACSIQRAFQKTFRSAFQKELDESRWKKVALFMIGGASRQKEISDALRKKFGHIISFEAIKIPNIKTIVSDDVDYRLAVAAGLSYPVGLWPEEIRPSSVKPWRPGGHMHTVEADSSILYES